MIRGDLHIHTIASDGLLSPKHVVERAQAGGLGFYAICDHNTLLGLEEARRASDERGPVLIHGVELSARPAEGEELHILGYGFDPQSGLLREVCEEIVERKHEQLREIVRRLGGEGIDVNMDSLLQDEVGYTGRPALARQLVSQGVVRTTGSAFWRYLGEGASTYVPMPRYSPQRCIDAIRSADGVAVLAHPQMETIDRWLETLVGMGLHGVEAMRPRLDGTRQLYVEMAAEHFDLFVTGGSDWHGRDNEAELGEFSVPAELLEGFFTALRNRCHQSLPLPT